MLYVCALDQQLWLYMNLMAMRFIQVKNLNIGENMLFIHTNMHLLTYPQIRYVIKL